MIRVISGAQTGVDEAALLSASDLGIKTGGFCPINCRRQDGDSPELITLYGLTETGSGYKERTWKNVESANLTFRIATDFNSAGEKCTLNAIKHFRKPHYDIDLNKYEKYSDEQKIAVLMHCVSLIFWYCGKDGTVNFAGNSEKTSPGIFKKSGEIIYNMLSIYQQNK